jgi:hypothetical protein
VAISAKVEGLERLRARMMALVGPDQEGALLKANTASAREFERLVRSAVPVGDPAGGHLVSTLGSRQVGPTGVEVSIGEPGSQGYPLHLEAGHRARDGSHVPGKPFWYPAKRLTKKRARSRIVRAERAVIKSHTSGGAP